MSQCLSKWVFLRGLVRESAHWDDFPERFAAAIPGSQVFPVDFPGTGVHWRERSPFSIAAIMEAARSEALQRTADGGDNSPLFVLSISLGAMTGIEWALRYPSELSGLVLINTSLAGLSPPYRRLNWRILPEVLAIAVERDVARREEGILRLTSNSRALSHELIDARVEAFHQRPVSGRTLLRQLWAASRFRPSLKKPLVPVLLLSGQGDRMVSPRCTDDIARVWYQEPRRHPTAGHDLPLDDPDWVIQVVREWQQQLGTPDQSAL